MQWTAPAAGHMQVSTRGLDLAKDVFQVRGIDANENGSKSSSDANLFVFWLQNSIWRPRALASSVPINATTRTELSITTIETGKIFSIEESELTSCTTP